MPIPSYKQIHMKAESRNSTFDQLSAQQFGQVPFVLSIDHLANQIESLKNIEDYLIEKNLTNYPYPVYIISSVDNYLGKLQLFKNISECPRFYKQKIKQLNIKENKILQKIYLKQKNLQNIQGIDIVPHFSDYAKTHKKLHNLKREESFYDLLIGKLEEYYDQKK